ncbi:hypothetical protein C8E03_11420 [Lachnotalea glycerini]|uniref:DUF6774 domain-containing protein n=1 Tax=Lachnotalea glycerini TaxID=1763509 RepID=A0A255NJ84_9FIRM|nr:DUF6774 domain-containing protein [Lachnotalea glycerini]OYP00860.1 hypothetical protein CG709_11395 [Lachnotalea glycerini]PXV85943.1 hypothetical protein C8E03_11420 [Lachnotalea glycerini]RDY31379.1 hypothetical protein CG710_009670 [Lachnotalea glycerini]
MDECELVAFISAIACSISKCYTTDELSLFSSMFSQLGDSLGTIAARRDLCETGSSTDNNNNIDNE